MHESNLRKLIPALRRNEAPQYIEGRGNVANITRDPATGRFVLNGVSAMLKRDLAVDATLQPMVRGRLVEVNGAPFDAAQLVAKMRSIAKVRERVIREGKIRVVDTDPATATETVVGENIFKPAHGAPVFLNAGRFVTAPDGTIEFRAGPQDFLDYFVNGDTSVIQPLCAALA